MLDLINNRIQELKRIEAKNNLIQMQTDSQTEIIEQSISYYQLFSDKNLLLWLMKEKESNVNPRVVRECNLLIGHFLLGQIQYNPEMSILLDEYEKLFTKRMLARKQINKSSSPQDYEIVHQQEIEISTSMSTFVQQIIKLRLEMSKDFGFENYTQMHHRCFLSDDKCWNALFVKVLAENVEKAKVRQKRVLELTGIDNTWCSIKKLEEMISNKFINISPLGSLQDVTEEMGIKKYLDKITINFVPDSAWVNLALLNPPNDIVVHIGDIGKIEIYNALYHEFGHAISYMACPSNWAFFFEPYLMETPSIIFDWISNCKWWQDRFLNPNDLETEILDLASMNKLPEVLINACETSIISTNIYQGENWQSVNKYVHEQKGKRITTESEKTFFLSGELVNPFFQLGYIIGFYLTPLIYQAYENKFGIPISKHFASLLFDKMLTPGNSISPKERIWALLDALHYDGVMLKELEEVIDNLG